MNTVFNLHELSYDDHAFAFVSVHATYEGAKSKALELARKKTEFLESGIHTNTNKQGMRVSSYPHLYGSLSLWRRR